MEESGFEAAGLRREEASNPEVTRKETEMPSA